MHITNLVRMYLIHGSVPYFILLCTLLPLVKDNFSDITSSGNYRAIAGGSLLLKLLDIVIIMLEGEKLTFSELQFAYQAGVSGNMCTYEVLETVDYFFRHASEVFICTVDITKGF